MRWMNDNKSRVMDFFRKQDRDHDGKITRQEFIDGILQSSTLAVFTSFPVYLLWNFTYIVLRLSHTVILTVDNVSLLDSSLDHDIKWSRLSLC